jgi:hypothetical protein
MELNQLRKLAGLPPVMEATRIPPKVEREVEKMLEQLEKISEHHAALSLAFEVFESHLKTSSLEVLLNSGLYELHDANYEAKGNLAHLKDSIELCEYELRNVLDQDD